MVVNYYYYIYFAVASIFASMANFENHKNNLDKWFPIPRALVIFWPQTLTLLNHILFSLSYVIVCRRDRKEKISVKRVKVRGQKIFKARDILVELTFFI